MSHRLIQAPADKTVWAEIVAREFASPSLKRMRSAISFWNTTRVDVRPIRALGYFCSHVTQNVNPSDQLRFTFELVRHATATLIS